MLLGDSQVASSGFKFLHPSSLWISIFPPLKAEMAENLFFKEGPPNMNVAETEALKQQLLANDATFAALAEEHHQYETRLSELAELHYPSEEEQIEEATLKKKKLFLKDQMEEIMRHHKEQQHVAST